MAFDLPARRSTETIAFNPSFSMCPHRSLHCNGRLVAAAVLGLALRLRTPLGVRSHGVWYDRDRLARLLAGAAQDDRDAAAAGPVGPD